MAVAALSTRADADHFSDPSNELDRDIQSVRQEIQKLTQRRQILGSTLQNATKLQSALRNKTDSSLPSDVSPLVQVYEDHAQSNAHRLAFGVTAFPFTDPNPDIAHTPSQSLLGIRIDTCGRSGKYRDAHYIFCQRTGSNDNELRIHKHTIPAFVNLKKYEEQYLPVSDEGYRSEESVDGDAASQQNLHGLVERVRQDLVSWVYRQDAVELLREQLELVEPVHRTESSHNVGAGRFGVESITPIDIETRYIRLQWQDGQQAVTGRVKISNEGLIERAIIYGEDGIRLGNAERMLSEQGNTVHITELGFRLEQMEYRQSAAV